MKAVIFLALVGSAAAFNCTIACTGPCVGLITSVPQGSAITAASLCTTGVFSSSIVNGTNAETCPATGDGPDVDWVVVCAMTGCDITCTGDFCATDLPKNVSNGVAVADTDLCISGSFVASSLVNGTAGTACPAAGYAKWVVTCSNTPTANMTEAQWNAYAAANGAHAASTICNCNPTTDVFSLTPVGAEPNSFIKGPCVLKCTSARQVTASAGVLCPATANTPDLITKCFEAAACAGLLTTADTCVYGVNGVNSVQTPCPPCNESKKGLLGLLGLLGLIPLLLCSLLLCCLLLLCRRKKAEREVHFATFDAGAPNCDMPVVHNTSAVHHSTYVGAPHVAGPVACY